MNLGDVRAVLQAQLLLPVAPGNFSDVVRAKCSRGTDGRIITGKGWRGYGKFLQARQLNVKTEGNWAARGKRLAARRMNCDY
jgi:hypothetical protein